MPMFPDGEPILWEPGAFMGASADPCPEDEGRADAAHEAHAVTGGSVVEWQMAEERIAS